MMRPILLAAGMAWLCTVAASAHPSEAHRIEDLTAAIREHPDDPDLYLRRGRSHANEDRLELALADYREAERLGDPALVAHDLGVVLYRQGKLAEAREAFTRFLVRAPDHAPTLQYRARVERDMGDVDAAVADYEAYFALQERPNPGDFVAAARLLEESEQGGVDAALRMLDRGIERLGVIPQLQRPAVALEQRRGRPDAAIERLASLRTVLDDSPEWKVDMAELLLSTGRSDEADALLEAASLQLDALRATKARRTQRDRIESLRARTGGAAIR